MTASHTTKAMIGLREGTWMLLMDGWMNQDGENKNYRKGNGMGWEERRVMVIEESCDDSLNQCSYTHTHTHTSNPIYMLCNGYIHICLSYHVYERMNGICFIYQFPMYMQCIV